ncbi:hypothetical protein TNCV_1893611 [Trichonephila clavipes]|nr:hypothetical protein TNCV_1893611 [Trichonephila clavipes]
MDSKVNDCSEAKNWNTNFCIENLLGKSASDNQDGESSKDQINFRNSQEGSDNGADAALINPMSLLVQARDSDPMAWLPMG